MLKNSGNPIKTAHKTIPGINGMTINEPSSKAEEPAVIFSNLTSPFRRSKKRFNTTPKIQNKIIKICQYQKFEAVLFIKFIPDNINAEKSIPLYRAKSETPKATSRKNSSIRYSKNNFFT